MMNNCLKTIFIVFLLLFYSEINYIHAETSSDTIFEETIFEETTFEETTFKEMAFETINYVRNNIHDADINELDLSLVQDENSFSDNINSLSYSDVLKEVNWKEVIPKVAVGGAIITVAGVLSVAGGPAFPFVFGIVAKDAIIGGAIGSAVVSVLNTCIQSIKSGQPIDKRIIKYAIEGAADGFMWGAIGGAVFGGIQYSVLKSSTIIKNGVLAKNLTKINKQGHLSKTDNLGRLAQVEAKELKLVAGTRKPYQQQKVVREAMKRNPTKYVDRNYHGGHIIAARFGGSPYGDNLVPMPEKINRRGGKWYEMEEEIAKLLQSGNRVTDFKVKINYKGADKMPDAFHVSYKVNGKIVNKIIGNRYR